MKSLFAAKMMSFSLVLALAPSLSRAHEHSIGNISGPGIDLKVGDHAIAGSIGKSIVFGDKAGAGSTLILKSEGHSVTSSFAKDGSTFAGIIRSDVEGVAKETRIEFVSVDQVQKTITMKANGTPFTVTISSERYENNHFIDPAYSTEINGEKISFAMTGAQACYGFSTHLIYMIVGAYLHGSH